MRCYLRRSHVLILLLTVVLVFSACGGSGQSVGEVDDKSIVMATDWPAFIDPGVGSKATDSIAFLNMYDTLVFPNDDGTISPWVAESWDANAESTQFTFYLRDDVVFHSGNKLTANDVKFSMDRLLTMGEGYAYLYSELIKDVEVLDDYSIRFSLNTSSGVFPSTLIRLYIADEKTVMANLADGSYGDFGDYGKAWLQVNDAGSGPYKVKEMRTEEFLLMERYDDYWQAWDEAAPETVKMMGGIDSTGMRTMMSRGELHISDDAQTPETYKALTDIEGVNLQRSMLGVNLNITLNTKLAPTDDIHVRKAMAYAFDYQSAADNIYIGSVKASGPIPVGMAGGLTSDESPYYYSLEKAREEIEKSPYYQDLVDGKMAISFTYCSEGGQQQEKFALLMKAGMEKIGVNVQLSSKPFANMMTDAQTMETTPNAAVVAFAPSYLDGSGFLRSRYHSSSCGTWEQMEWLQDASIDAMIEEAVKISDQDVRNAKYKEITQQLVDLCPTIWALDLATTNAVNEAHIVGSPVMDRVAEGKEFIYAMGYSAYYKSFRLK